MDLLASLSSLLLPMLYKTISLQELELVNLVARLFTRGYEFDKWYIFLQFCFSVLLKVKKMSFDALMNVFVNGIIRRSQGVIFYYFY